MNSTLLILAPVAGLATVLSPCILPILPILVGRSLKSHRYGPVALVGGLVVAFALVGSVLSLGAEVLGPLNSWLRLGAIWVLLLLGVAAAFPKLSYGFFAQVAHFTQRFLPPTEAQDRGLWSEFWVGTQLGVVWIPCAGPVLGSIITLVAVEQAVVQGFLALFAYALGAAVPMLALAYGGKGLVERTRWLYPHTELLQRIGGVVIALTAIAILLGLDSELQRWLAPLFPPPLL
ncbi:cytochrome c biogenesis CcdA family protein [Candidatus Cyanaurora vandensis]|uniref:cytochrome c biogenesis CcdA family protein n=1 Tax=Candidatus Cyanaurora vandensis TaxID=2714958 RepID=UPI00257F62A3|nr:cytochrome c biogenesis CcdA family protein [Candidatus Cyanaurora vandensis]